MRITCLITVCAYLLSTVSSDEIQYLNRLKRTKSREESSLDNATAKKELNPNPGIRPDVFSTLRKSRPQRQIETIQKPFQSKVHESEKPHDRSRRPVKRLKVRSIAGSTYEVDDNEIHEFIEESIPEAEKAPIYIKPVFRVVTKKTIFDSIVDVLNQLLEPHKKELGPVVGPIKMPGSKRKIYLRLLEPVDASHVNVRFVTEVPAPVIDEESQERESLLPYLPFIDPAVSLLQKQHPVESSDATFSSSNRHTIQLPRNSSHISSKGRGSQSKVKHPPKNFKKINKENTPPAKVEDASGAESDKNHLYYQSGDDSVKHEEIIKNTTENEQGSSESEPWYQLSTHRLPFRQIAPLYPLSAMVHTSSSYENTYKVPSDSFTAPSPDSSSYEQYSNVNAAPGFYDQSYTIPNTYSTTYQKQNEFSNAPSSYPISYHNQNQFNNARSSTSYVKQNDLFSAPTAYTSSHEKLTNVPLPPSSYATSQEAQNDVQTSSSSQNALHVISPPAYFVDSRQVSENDTNKLYEYTMQYDKRSPIDQVGKVKREKSESNFQKSQSNFQKSADITSDDNRERWQPLMFVSSENANLQKAFANLANGNQYETVEKQQPVNHPRQIAPSTIETGRVNQRQDSKRHNPSIANTRNSRCLTSDKGDRCERTESTNVSTPQSESTIKIMQTQSTTTIEPIVSTPKLVASSSTVETLRSNAITKSSWIEEPQKLMKTIEGFVTSSTTERLPALIKTIKSTTESVENETTLNGSINNLSKKSAASSTTETSSEASISKSTTKRRQLAKRPMIMKKPTFVLKKTEASSTTRKSTISSTTEKTKTTMRRSKYRSAISKTKSSTT